MSTIINGGRLRKTKRGIVTFAPFVVAAAMAATSASAGTCTEGSTGGTYTCTGATAAGETTETLEAESGEQLMVTTDRAFGIQVNSGNAFDVTAKAGSTGLRMEFSGNGDIVAGGVGFNISNMGTGDTYIDIDQDVLSTNTGFEIETAVGSGAATLKARNIDTTQTGDTDADADGISFTHNGTGDLVVEVSRNVDADARGIRVGHLMASGSVTVTAMGNVHSGQSATSTGSNRHGIAVSSSTMVTTATITAERNVRADNGGNGVAVTHAGSGDLTITTRGTIMASGDRPGTGSTTIRGKGIYVNQTMSGAQIDLDTRITAEGDITAAGRGIEVSHASGGDAVISTAGVSSTNQEAIHIGTGSQAGSIDLTAGGIVSSAGDSISIDHDGTGSVVVQTQGVTSSARIGINISSASSSTDTDVTVNGNVEAELQGISIDHDGTGSVVVETQGVKSSSEKGLDISAAASSTTMDVTVNGNVEALKQGISLTPEGSGDVTLTVGANSLITSTDEEGIRFNTRTAADALNITINGDITAQKQGVYVGHGGTDRFTFITGADSLISSKTTTGIGISTGAGTTGMTVTLAGDVGTSADKTPGTGVSLLHLGSEDLTVSVTGDIFSNMVGFFAQGAGTEMTDDFVDITVDSRIDGGMIGLQTANGAGDGGADIITVRLGDNANVSGDIGLGLANSNSSGQTIVHLGGTITGSMGSAIAFKPRDAQHLAEQRVVISTGRDYTLSGKIVADASITTAGDAIIELAGEGSDTFSFTDDLNEKFTDFKNIHKTGSGTWTITGDQDIDHNLNQVRVDEGTLVLGLSDELTLDDRTLTTDRREGGSEAFIIAQGATLEFAEDFAVQVGGGARADIALAGTLRFAHDASFNTQGSIIASETGRIVADVDLNADNRRRFVLDGDVTGTDIPFVFNFVGEIPNISEGEALTIENLIRVTGDASPDSFAFSANGPVVIALEHSLDGTVSRWNLAATGISVVGALYETLPAALSQVASLESLQQRIQGRIPAVGEHRFWGRVSRTSSEFEPFSTADATHEIKDNVAELGVNLPLFINHPYIPGRFAVGADIGFGNVGIDVTTSQGGQGKIRAGSVIAGISGTWENDGVYFDGQLQYASFTNDIKTAHEKLTDANASTVSAGLEVGYGMDIDGFFVTPSAQIMFADVELEDFTDSSGNAVSLEDGETLTGRIGVAVESEWEGVLPDELLLRAHANVLAHLEGEVGIRVAGMEMVSERKEPTVDLGFGAAYAWGEYTVSADISTQQGGEAEGYAGTLGVKYEF